MRFTYSKSVYSDINLVKGFIDRVLQEVSQEIIDEDMLFDIRLILSELIINGVFHGNECDRLKLVNVNISIVNNKFKIEVTDEGTGIDYDINSYDQLSKKSSGRGLVIVRGLSDELIVDQNKITAIKCLN